MAGGCAAGTEQCLQHCRPYQVPSGTLRYSPSIFCCFRYELINKLRRCLQIGPVYCVPCTVRCRQRPSHVVSFGIWFFPILYQIRCFICLHLEIKHLTARHVFYFGARLRGVDRVSRFHHVFPGNDCLKQLIQGLFLEQLMRDLF